MTRRRHLPRLPELALLVLAGCQSQNAPGGTGRQVSSELAQRLPLEPRGGQTRGCKQQLE